MTVRPSPGGDKEPRNRNRDGTWRKKRCDAGTPRPLENKKKEK